MNYLHYVLCVREALELVGEVTEQSSLTPIEEAYAASAVPQPIIDYLKRAHTKKGLSVPTEPKRVLAAARDYLRSAKPRVLDAMIAHFEED